MVFYLICGFQVNKVKKKGPNQRENCVQLHDFGRRHLNNIYSTPRGSSLAQVTFFSVTLFKDQKLDQTNNERRFGELFGLQDGFRQTLRLMTAYHIIIIELTERYMLIELIESSACSDKLIGCNYCQYLSKVELNSKTSSKLANLPFKGCSVWLFSV